jgi:general secretion pathway protein D
MTGGSRWDRARWLRRTVPATLLFCAIAASPMHVAAQDTANVRRTEQGILVDFQDTELRFVITALAEAANLNVSYGELPSRRITLRLRQPVPAVAVPALLRNLALSNGLLYFEENGLIRLEAAGAGTQGRATADSTAAEVRLYVHHLKHARAARMAATLQAIFGGSATGVAPVEGLSQIPLSERLRGQAIAPAGDSAVSVAPPAPAAARGVQPLQAQLRGNIQIVPDETTNALLVRALPSDWETIRAAVEAMDLRPLQVLIEVVIAELRTTDESQLGVSAKVARNNGATPPNTVGGELKSAVATDFILTMTQRGPTFSADFALAALASRGNVRILSRPLLLAQNNQESRILVGEQRPFVQVFRSLPTDNAIRDQVVQYRDVATTLTIRPTINPDGYVNLQVLQEVSTATDATQFGAPIISTREAASHLFVRDGQTAVLGGLVSRQTDRVRTGIPILSRIPLLGGLFGSTTDKETTSELFLFLTPHVITSDEDAVRLRDGLQREGADSTGLKPTERPIVPPVRRP